MTESELAQVWRDYKATGAVELRNALAVEYLPIVRGVARRLKRIVDPTIDIQDLVQEGALGLIELIERFDLYREDGCDFRFWCRKGLMHHIIDALRRFYFRPRGRWLDGVDEYRLEDTHQVSPEVRLLMQDMLDSVVGYLKILSPRERMVLFLCHYEDLTLHEIGARLSISHSQVWYSHRKVISWLREIFGVENVKMESPRHRLKRHERRKRNSADLPVGVSKHRARFRAKVSLYGRRVYIGTYDTPQEAGLAYQRAVGL